RAARLCGGALARSAIAVAAMAMALGMTLAMIVTVASLRETLRVWVESTLRSDLWIKAQAGRGRGLVGDLPSDVIPFLAAVPGVEAVDPFRARDAVDSAGRPFTIGSGDFRIVARAGGVPLLDGRDPRSVAREARERDEALVSEPYARRFGAGKGEAVVLSTPKGSRAFRVAGVYRDYSNDRRNLVLDRDLYLSLFDDPRATSAAILAAPGTDPEELRRRILKLAAGRYALSITTNRELRRDILAIFDRTFAVARGLEAIAIGVAILGIANALTASAVERRRAFGLLAAVGAARVPIRRSLLIQARAARRGGDGRGGRSGGGVLLPASPRHQPPILRMDRRGHGSRRAPRRRGPRRLRSLGAGGDFSRVHRVRRLASLGAARRMMASR